MGWCSPIATVGSSTTTQTHCPIRAAPEPAGVYGIPPVNGCSRDGSTGPIPTPANDDTNSPSSRADDEPKPTADNGSGDAQAWNDQNTLNRRRTTTTTSMHTSASVPLPHRS